MIALAQGAVERPSALSAFSPNRPRTDPVAGSDLLRGRIDLFSTDMLIDMLARLGIRVRLVVRPSRARRAA